MTAYYGLMASITVTLGLMTLQYFGRLIDLKANPCRQPLPCRLVTSRYRIMMAYQDLYEAMMADLIVSNHHQLKAA